MGEVGNSWQPSRLAGVVEGLFFQDPRIHHTLRPNVKGPWLEATFRQPLTPDPVPGLVPEGFMKEPPPHPDPVPGSVPEGSQAEPPSHSYP
ncbi:hypothetical protein CRENBAI_011844 [Crenichthys baileyi]|uniref:Uncharacterized protein n=1 Tax=Crenichthys baileyi TaxID=28760 RepID=A0AAV9RKI5_9TELE